MTSLWNSFFSFFRFLNLVIFKIKILKNRSLWPQQPQLMLSNADSIWTSYLDWVSRLKKAERVRKREPLRRNDDQAEPISFILLPPFNVVTTVNDYGATRSFIRIKVQLFWEGHKNLRDLHHDFGIYLVNVKTMRKIAQIFVAF